MHTIRDVREAMSSTSFDVLMSDIEPRVAGQRYEAIVKILHLYKVLPNQYHYSKIDIKHLDEFLDSGVATGPDGAIDLEFVNLEGATIRVSVKYTKKFDPDHEGGINQMLFSRRENMKFGYICKNKKRVLDRVSSHEIPEKLKIYKEICDWNLLLGEDDIKIAYNKFQKLEQDDNYIQEHYLNNPRRPITIHYHQQLAFGSFVNNMPHEKIHLLEYVPRTGKSIIILLMVKWILENKLSERILLITPICKTIDAFVYAVKDYADFSGIPIFVIRNENQPVPSGFTGLVISSIQYFKVGLNKSVEGYQTIISDEAHIGTYTENSLDNIFNSPNFKYKIFASGTPCGTQNNFNIPNKCVYTWTNVHSKLMLSPEGQKALGAPPDVDLEYYKQVPTQIYMPMNLEPTTMFEYNKIYPDSEKGFSWQSLLALIDPRNHESGFVIKNRPHGIDFLKKMLRTIIPDNPNDEHSIYSRARVLRSEHKSRDFEDSKELVVIFLPTHTNEGTIDEVQQALVKFCEKHDIWKGWKVLYDNAQTPNFDIQKEMKRYQELRFVLFLGSKNTVGVTYEDCDLSVHLDTTRSTDFHIQKLARAGTGQPGKTIYINADYNIQRRTDTIASVLTMARKVLKTEDNLNTAEHLHRSKTFIIDCDDISSETIIREIDSTYDVSVMLNNIEWNTRDLDTILSMSWTELGDANFEGTGTDVPTGEREPTERPPCEPSEPHPKHTPEEIEDVANKTHQLLQNFVIPIGAIMSAKYNQKNAIKNYSEEFMKLLCDKEKSIKKEHTYIVMRVCSTCREKNKQFIENIEQRFIDTRGDFKVYHELIYKHLKPSDEEKKNNAEIPTPPSLIREMLDKVPSDFWREPREVLDPCCGKGGFVVELFRRFDEGFKLEYPKLSEIKRRKFIIENIIHFWDISPLNVFLTQEILRVMSGGATTEYNSWVGDSLTKSTNKKFSLVVGNPPYESRSDSGVSKGGTNLYIKFIDKFFKRTLDNGYMLFVNPISWLGPSTNKQMGGGVLHNIFLSHDLLYLNINECKKYFNVGSTFSYYLLRNSNNPGILTDIVSLYNKKIELSKIDIKSFFHLKFLPIHITEETLKLVDRIVSGKNKLDICRCRILDSSNKNTKKHLSLEKTENFCYTTYHTTTKTYYSDIKIEDYNTIKILINMSGYIKPSIVHECNTTESKFYIKAEDEETAKSIVSLLENEDTTYFLKLCKYSGFNSRIVLESVSFV